MLPEWLLWGKLYVGSGRKNETDSDSEQTVTLIVDGKDYFTPEVPNWRLRSYV